MKLKKFAAAFLSGVLLFTGSGFAPLQAKAQDKSEVQAVQEELPDNEAGDALAFGDENVKTRKHYRVNEAGEKELYMEFRFDREGNLTREIYYDAGAVYDDTGYEYDSEGKMVKKVHYNPDGTVANSTAYVYDSNGVLTQQTDYYDNDFPEYITEYAYDRSLKSYAEYFRDGRVRGSAIYDIEGNQDQYSWADEDGSSYMSDYDPATNTENGTWYDQNGNPTEYSKTAYNEKRQILKEEYFKVDGTPDGYTIYEYNAKGNHIKTTGYGADGSVYNTWVTEYDDKDNIIREIHESAPDEYAPDGYYDRYEYAYDSRGNQISNIHYDKNGNVNNRIEETFDENGNKTSVLEVNEFGNIVRHWERAYDANGYEIKVVEYDGNNVEFHQEYERDEKGNAIKEIYFDENGTSYGYAESVYDENSNLVKYSFYKNDGTLDYYVENEYNGNGTCVKYSLYNADGTLSYYEINVTDSFGNVIRCEKYDGNGVLTGTDEIITEYEYYDPTGATTATAVTYRTHCQSYGWLPFVANGAMSGTSGESKRLEGIEIKVKGNPGLGIQYTTHCQTYGWLPWSVNGEMSGTSGESKRMEAIKIRLTGADKNNFDVYYRVHAQSFGWLGWAKNGEPAGTAGLSKRMEGIQILVVRKGTDFDHNAAGITSKDDRPYIAVDGATQPVVGKDDVTSAADPQIGNDDTTVVMYQTHVQSYGWQAWKANGQMSGTSGESKRLEGIKIRLSNKTMNGGIRYTTHVQSYGWQGNEDAPLTWKRDGEMSGTSGESKRLEAIRISLYGDMSGSYDIYYRVHAQNYGWLAWAKNGEPAGTAGYGKRLEGIQIVLVKKGSAVPGATYNGVTSTNEEAFISK